MKKFHWATAGLVATFLTIHHASALSTRSNPCALRPLCYCKYQTKGKITSCSYRQESTVTHLSSNEDQNQLDISNVYFDLNKFKSFSQRAIENSKEGKFGTRGEQYFIAQAFVVLCILGGGVPFVGDTLKFLFGPVLVIAGIVSLGTGVYELGDSLTPFATPVSNMSLKTDGIFQYVRHPLYAGLLSIAMGGSILSDSASRIILTVVLFFVLTLKAEFEEVEIEKKFPSYKDYKEQVTGRFIPSQLTDTVTSLLAKLGEPKDNQ